ncbi:MAG: sulfatase family protein [Phycisphaeraceae bacterium]
MHLAGALEPAQEREALAAARAEGERVLAADQLLERSQESGVSGHGREVGGAVGPLQLGIVGVFGKSVFEPERLTLPEMLQNQGYHTACIGKWHLGWDWNAIRVKEGNGPDCFDWSKPIPDGPLAHGFDHYFGDTVINFPPYAWIEDDRMIQTPDTMMDTSKWPEIKEGNWECRPGPMVTGWNPYEVMPTLGDKAVAYIASRKTEQQPFFLFFAYPSPHAPIIPNDEFDGKSEAGPYGDFVFETDHIAGRIMEAIDRAGLSDNTIVIFTADNGPEHYAYPREQAFGHWSAKPLRGLKRDIYEGGHRVPFIVRWPGVTEPGTVKSALVSQIDFFATFASHLGVDLPDDAAEDSHDMLAYMKGEASRVRESHIHNTFSHSWAIRDGAWLLIDAKTGRRSRRGVAEWEERNGYRDDDLPVELYNLDEDLGQRKNLAAEHPDKVLAMRALMKKIREDGRTRSIDSGSTTP